MTCLAKETRRISLLVLVWSAGAALASAQSTYDPAADASTSTGHELEAETSQVESEADPSEVGDTTWGDQTSPADAASEPAPNALGSAEVGSAGSASMALPDNSGAPPPEQPKVRVRGGLRLGYALPLGDLVDGTPLGDVAASAIPLTLEISAAHYSGWELGLLLRLAFVSTADPFEQSCSDCSVFGGRLAVQLDRHLNPGGVFDPWIGLTVGIESLMTSRESTYLGYRYSSSTTYRALPDLGVQAGVDFGSDSVRFGPYVSLTVGSYSDVSNDFECKELLGCPFVEESVASDISNTGWHSWLSVGVRGSYVL